MDEIKSRREQTEHDKARKQAGKLFRDLDKKFDLDNIKLPPELAKACEHGAPASVGPHLAAVNLVLSYGVGRSMMFHIGLEKICETIDEIAKISPENPGQMFFAAESPHTNILLRSISTLHDGVWVTDNATGAAPYLTQAYRFIAFGLIEIFRLFMEGVDVPVGADATWPPLLESMAKGVAYAKSLVGITYEGLRGLGHGA